MTPLWIYAFAVLIVYGTSKLLRMGSRERNLPPGPPTAPVLGNLHQIPLTGLYRKIREWGGQYGSVFPLKMASGTAAILLDRMAIHELLGKKGSIYSDRPRDHVASIIDSGGLPLWDKNIHWMSQRKVVSSALSPTQVEVKLRRMKEAEAVILIRDLISTPERFSDHVKRTIFSITEIVTWGSGHLLMIAGGHIEHATCPTNPLGITPGAYPPFDQFPFMKHLPDWLSPWRIRAEQLKKRVDSFWADARWRLDKRRRNGDKRDCIADNLLDAIQPIDIPLTDRQFNDFLGFLVAAGSDTTSATTLTSIRYLAAHPHVQKKAQAKLDAACGADRLPLWSDHGKLPYINCIIKEGMRICSAVPVVFPHRARQDNWYQNMLIPIDSLLLIPAWAIHHSESCGYKDPECYHPDRFNHHPNLAPSYAANSNYMNRDHYAYGAGRRLCPGIHLAEHMQWHITATLLWAFDIVPATSAKTREKKQLDIEAFRDSLV